ncbi:MAG: division/cell wall cluster transcriptional repressor MraZ, partial [Lentisphaerae bacterium]|nr:division/cell wall cluster transcriptional repressor MraZ [Lentisphaerota bacterium]
AGLEKEVKIIGALDHFELWNPELWEKVTSAPQSQMSKAAKYLNLL